MKVVGSSSVQSLKKGDIVFRLADDTYCKYVERVEENERQYLAFTFMYDIGYFTVPLSAAKKMFKSSLGGDISLFTK